MSYFQPLITSAFSNYAVNRGIYADRSSGIAQGDAETNQAGGVTPNDRVTSTSELEKSGEVGKSQISEKGVDRDQGKPKSLSGDVLDLSREALQAQEKSEKTAVQDRKEETSEAATRKEADSVELKKAELNEEAEADAAQRLDRNRNAEEETENDAIQLQREPEESSLQSAASGQANELTPEEEQQVQELQARDAEVRTHEQQHVSAGGAYVTGGPSYTYQTGPDGRQYAIGGEVSIDTGEVSGDPEATIRKMQTVAAAALAPAEPSSQDQKVAAAARQAEAKARMELSRQQAEKATEQNAETRAADNSEGVGQSLASDEPSNDPSESTDSAVFEGRTSVPSNADDKNGTMTSGMTPSSSAFAKNSAYQAQSTMSSGQIDGTRFAAFA